MVKTAKPAPDLAFETEAAETHGHPVAGIDEAGRGPLAGPVVAGAVILDTQNIPDGLNDSKALSPVQRDALYDAIVTSSQWGVGLVEPAEIDTINILQATMAAMQLAVAHLPTAPNACLIDGNRCPKLDCPATAIVKGDARSLSIAAASIVAKVTRDRIMLDLDRQHPGYAWASNMGYGTQAHRDALMRLGPTPHHRYSFAPVREAARIRP
ncbi:MAG: ribonuclease HII [Hyphomicrobiaceae bacterium]